MEVSSVMSRRSTLSVVLSLLCLIGPACADRQAAVKATVRQQRQADDEAAASRIRKAAEQGNADAQNELGLLYSEGRGVDQSFVQAKQWFEKAAEQGHAGAQVNLGTLYLLGNGAPQSDQMALAWFRRAAEKEDALAFAKLGYMYAYGRGVVQDYIKAHMWYNLSAARGEKRAMEQRDALAKQMTPAQIAEAQKLAAEWTPKASSRRAYPD
jgi:TPR repeat protein